jgi:hypothetical protein
MAFDEFNVVVCLQRRGPSRILTGFPVRQSIQHESTDHQRYNARVLSEPQPFVKRTAAHGKERANVEEWKPCDRRWLAVISKFPVSQLARF